jgi:hypothetical protein
VTGSGDATEKDCPEISHVNLRHLNAVSSEQLAAILLLINFCATCFDSYKYHLGKKCIHKIRSSEISRNEVKRLAVGVAYLLQEYEGTNNLNFTIILKMYLSTHSNLQLILLFCRM